MKSLRSQKEIKQTEEWLKFLKEIKPDQLVDNFPMFIRRQELIRYLTRYKLFEMILDVKGSIMECGVFQGASLMFFAQLSAMYEPYAFNREIIGFDTFEGFVDVEDKDNPASQVGDFSDTNIKILEKCIAFYDSNRPIGHIPKVKLVKGDVVDTLPQYFKDNPHTLVAMLYLDLDLYKPTKAAIENVLPRMPKGAVIAFDELNHRAWEGETLAVLETLDINNLEIKKFPEEPLISYAVI
jgi:hypothetical protein